VIAEVIRTDAKFCELLREGRKAAAHEYWVRECGGISVAQHALQKVLEGLVDPRMAERVIGMLPEPDPLLQAASAAEKNHGV
jgi:general secretion pathway protein E